MHKEYILIACVGIDALVKMVNSMLKKGWQCQGGTSYGGGQYMQAMVM